MIPILPFICGRFCVKVELKKKKTCLDSKQMFSQRKQIVAV